MQLGREPAVGGEAGVGEGLVEEGDVPSRILEQAAWVAVVGEPSSILLFELSNSQPFSSLVHSNATSNLNAADSSYDPTTAVSFYGVEGRSENAYRSLIRPAVAALLLPISKSFAVKRLSSLSSSTFAELTTRSPQAVITPFFYAEHNLAPFDIPVASAVTFVGLIYMLILSFFIVNIGLAAREQSGLERKLTTASLIRVRLVSVLIAYFPLSLFYSLLSLAFQVDFSRKWVPFLLTMPISLTEHDLFMVVDSAVQVLSYSGWSITRGCSVSGSRSRQ